MSRRWPLTTSSPLVSEDITQPFQGGDILGVCFDDPVQELWRSRNATGGVVRWQATPRLGMEFDHLLYELRAVWQPRVPPPVTLPGFNAQLAALGSFLLVTRHFFPTRHFSSSLNT